jgi:hypothetical protein
MAKEKKGYRENLEFLNNRFPDHDMLTIEEVMQVAGYSSRKTVKRYLGKYINVANRISKVYVANFMCPEEEK